MELHGKGVPLGVIHALAGAVVGVDPAHLARGQALRNHRVAVVLAGDVGVAGLDVDDRLVAAAVAVFQLRGLPAGGQRHHLMAQAQPEQGHLAQQFLDLGDAAGVLGGVAGAVGQHHAVGMPGEDLRRRRVGGHHRHLAAAALQLADDVALGAVIHQRDGAALFARRGEDFLRLRGGLRHAAGDGVA